MESASLPSLFQGNLDLGRVASAPALEITQSSTPSPPPQSGGNAPPSPGSHGSLFSRFRRKHSRTLSAPYVIEGQGSTPDLVEGEKITEETEVAKVDDSDEVVVRVAEDVDLSELYFDDQDVVAQVANDVATLEDVIEADDEELQLSVDPVEMAAFIRETAPSKTADAQDPVQEPTPEQPRAPEVIAELRPEDLLRFQRWMHCFAVVTFDLELGQALETVYPPVKFTETEKSDICFNAFADSNSSGVGDTEHTFRIKWPSATDGTGSTKGRYLFGFVLFRQCKDDRIRRGYFQKSVVLLSERPYVGLFRHILRMLATTFFDVGQPILESATHTIARWPLATPEVPLELPFLGSMLYYTIPSFLNGTVGWGAMRKSTFEVAPNQFSLSSCGANIFRDMRDVLPDLWTVWELALVAEPLVVMSPSVTLCADAVLGIVAMISPVPYGGDYRPYFTIHDSDFREYTTRTKTPAHVMLGVTNPFFVKAFEHWPHTLRIGAASKKRGAGGGGGGPLKAAQSSSLDFAPGLKTGYARCVAVDKQLLKAVLERNVDEDSANALLLNRFQELTSTFLKPVDAYFTTLVPVEESISAFAPMPTLKPFDAPFFIRDLEKNPGAEVKATFRGNIADLYRRFIRSPNFSAYLRDKVRQTNRRLRKVLVKALIELEPEMLAGKSKQQLKDLSSHVQDELNSFTGRAWVGESGVRRLESLRTTLHEMGY